MAKSRVKHKEPIMGSLNSPYRETGMRDFGLYPWWAFCYQIFNKTMYGNKYYGRKRYYGYRKKNYGNQNPVLGDALAEIIILLIAAILKLLGKLIYKLFEFAGEVFHHRMKTKEAFHLNINTPQKVTLLSTLQKQPNQTPSFSLPEISHPETRLEPQETHDSRYNLKKSLVTETEQGFLKVLEQAVGDRYRIVPQVLLSGIVSPKDSSAHFTNYHDFNKIKAKSIDFVLYDKESWTPRLAIELDDRSHLKWKRIQRDHFIDDLFDGVGLKILHMPVVYSHNLEYVRAEISQKIEI